MSSAAPFMGGKGYAPITPPKEVFDYTHINDAPAMHVHIAHLAAIENFNAPEIAEKTGLKTPFIYRVLRHTAVREEIDKVRAELSQSIQEKWGKRAQTLIENGFDQAERILEDPKSMDKDKIKVWTEMMDRLPKSPLIKRSKLEQEKTVRVFSGAQIGKLKERAKLIQAESVETVHRIEHDDEILDAEVAE